MNDSNIWILWSSSYVILLALLFLITRLNKQSFQLSLMHKEMMESNTQQWIHQNVTLLNLAVSKDLSTYSTLTSLVPQEYPQKQDSRFESTRNNDENEIHKIGMTWDELESNTLVTLPGVNF